MMGREMTELLQPLDEPHVAPLNINGTKPHEDAVELWTSEVMAVMYLIVGLFALFQVCKRTRAKPTALFKWYARLLIVACVLRMLYFGLPTKLTGVPYSPTDLAMYGPGYWWNLFMFIICHCGGNIAVYLAFGLVVLNWASILSDASKAFVRTFIGVEAAYAAFNVFLLLMYMTSGRYLQLLFVYSIVTAVFTLVGSVAFAVTGYRLLAWLTPRRAGGRRLLGVAPRTPRTRPPPYASPSRQGMHHGLEEEDDFSATMRQRVCRVTTVAGVVSLCFLLRSVLLAIQGALSIKAINGAPRPQLGGHWWWLFVTTYYVACEILCAAVVVVLMRPTATKSTAGSQASTVSVGDDTARYSVSSAVPVMGEDA